MKVEDLDLDAAVRAMAKRTNCLTDENGDPEDKCSMGDRCLCREDALAVIAAVAPLIAAKEREACAKVADEHLARIPDHNPDVQREDLVAQGYGNAALNIAATIRARQEDWA